MWRALREFGVVGASAAVVLLPVYLLLTIAWIERVMLVFRFLGQLGRRPRVGRLDEQVAADRAAVVEAVLA